MNDQSRKVFGHEKIISVAAGEGLQAGQYIGTANAASAMGANACTQDYVPTIRAAIEIRANETFWNALAQCVHGQRITRAGWNGADQYVTAQHPDKFSKMTAPYLVLKNTRNEFVPWVPSQGDLFARDWAVLPIQPV